MPLRVQVVTPEREVEVCDDAKLVIAKGLEGDLGIMPGRAPALIALGLGPLVIQREHTRDELLLDGGFMTVKEDNVIVLAEYAAIPAELDPSAVAEEVERARARIQTNADDEEAKKALMRAEAKLNLIQVG